MAGLVVRPGDWRGLSEAIGTASSLWGGMFFPIIPLIGRITGGKRREISARISARRMVAGYLDTFDPDILVRCNAPAIAASLVGNRHVTSVAEVVAGFSDDGTPSFGVGVVEVLSHFAKAELTFLRRDPLNIVIPKFARPYRAFLSSVFGSLPANIESAAKSVFPSSFKMETPECTIENFAEFLRSDVIFLRRLMNYELQIRSTEACLFFLNAGSAEDIIDYWNLRAAGWSVLPVPQQAYQSKAIKEVAAEFVNENYWSYRHNPELFHHTNVLKGRNAAPRDLVKFIHSLSISPPKSAHTPPLVIMPTYPRLWDEWAREKDSVDVKRVYASKSETEISDDAEKIEFTPVAPKFVSRFGGHSSPRFANDVEVRFYNRDEPYAEVIPSADKQLVRAIGAYAFSNWRFSRRGLSYLCEHPEFTVRLTPPRAERVLSEWFRCEGWEVELSDKGYIAKQMLKRLGGIFGSSVLASRGLIALLKKMTAARADAATNVLGVNATGSSEPAGKILKAKTFTAEIAKLCSKEGSPSPDKYLRHLLDLQMFRAGLEVQCPTCRQRWWQSLKD